MPGGMATPINGRPAYADRCAAGWPLTTSSIDQRESWTTMGESVDFVASQRGGLGQPISVHARSKSISDPAAVAAARCRVSALLS